MQGHDDKQCSRRSPAGFGTAMIEATKLWASEVGADELWVLTNRSNLPAKKDDETDSTMFTYAIKPC